MKTVIIGVYLPAAMKPFEVRLPAALNCNVAAHITADALSALSEGNYLTSRNSFFAWRANGKMLNINNTLEQENVINGSELLLI